MVVGRCMEKEMTDEYDELSELNEITATDFSIAVEYLHQHENVSYLEAILEFARRKNLSPEYEMDFISTLIDDSLKEKLLVECAKNKTVKHKVSTLF